MTFSPPEIGPQSLNFHAQHYKQGGRDAYALVMDLGELDSILPTPLPEANKKIVGSNRRFYPPHARTIADYLYDVEKWVMGSIVLGIAPRFIQYESYPKGNSEASYVSLGKLSIPVVGGLSSLEVLDGQHRRMAVRQVFDKLEGEIEDLDKAGGSANNSTVKRLASRKKALEELRHMSIQVTIFAESSLEDRRQMFSDLGQMRKMDEITLAQFNLRDPFNRAAYELQELSHSGLPLLTGKVEMEKSTPPLSSDNLLSLNQLSRCLTILRYGYGSRVSRQRFNEAQQEYREIVDEGIIWVDDFLPRAREEYETLLSIELEDGFVAKQRAVTVAYSATVMQLLAGCFHTWKTLKRDMSELETWLRNADFDLKSDNCVFLASEMLIKGDTSLISRSQNMKATIAYIVERAQTDDKIPEK